MQAPVSHELLLQTQSLFVASEKIDQTDRQEKERKRAAMNLIKEIMTKFKIADVNVATDLAAFTFGQSGGSVSAKALTPTTPASVLPKFKLYKLHVGFLDEASLITGRTK